MTFNEMYLQAMEQQALLHENHITKFLFFEVFLLY
jgi:hypothetical protein